MFTLSRLDFACSSILVPAIYTLLTWRSPDTSGCLFLAFKFPHVIKKQTFEKEKEQISKVKLKIYTSVRVIGGIHLENCLSFRPKQGAFFTSCGVA